MKPEKILYEDQKAVHDEIVKKIKKSFLNDVKEAYLIGSLASGKFGRYNEKHEGEEGSDIDLVVITDKIPKEWKYKGKFYNWHDLYLGKTIKINSTNHLINYLIPFNLDISIFWKKADEMNWKVEKLK